MRRLGRSRNAATLRSGDEWFGSGIPGVRDIGLNGIELDRDELR